MKVAVVGCGWAGNRHARAYRAAGAEVSWAIDVDETRAAGLGAEHSTTELAVALADPALGAVSVCLPHALHAEASVQAAARLCLSG